MCRQVRIAKGASALKHARDIAISRTVHGDAPARIQADTAGLLCPKQIASGVIFGDEDVRSTYVAQSVRSKCGIAGESASDVAITRGIKSNGQSMIIKITAARLVSPKDLARAVVLGDENIVTPGARKHDITEDS